MIDNTQGNKFLGDMCLPPMLQDAVVKYIQPIASQQYANSEECGFYFW